MRRLNKSLRQAIALMTWLRDSIQRQIAFTTGSGSTDHNRVTIKKRIYLTREIAKHDIFNYIEMFYNSVRRHTANNLLSPREFERRFESETGKCLLN